MDVFNLYEAPKNFISFSNSELRHFKMTMRVVVEVMVMTMVLMKKVMMMMMMMTAVLLVVKSVLTPQPPRPTN